MPLSTGLFSQASFRNTRAAERFVLCVDSTQAWFAAPRTALCDESSLSAVRIRVCSRTLAQTRRQRRLRDFARVRAGIEQLPLPLGSDFDGATDHFDRGLFVDSLR